MKQIDRSASYVYARVMKKIHVCLFKRLTRKILSVEVDEDSGTVSALEVV